MEDANANHGSPVWYQLYAPNIWEACEKLLTRVAASGTTVLGLTVDTAGGRNSETDLRLRPKDMTICHSCHQGPEGPANTERPMLSNLVDIKGGDSLRDIVIDTAQVVPLALRVFGAMGIRVDDERDNLVEAPPRLRR